MSEKKHNTTPSKAQEDLEARQKSDYVPDAALKTKTVNPNPFGSEAYAGVDPMYQNHASDTEKPFKAGSGPEKKLEDKVRKAHNLSGKETVEDAGTGGEAEVADTSGPEATRYLVPGQEGYDERAASGGPAVRADAPVVAQPEPPAQPDQPPANQ